jgi:hypothetical protein
MGAARPPLFFVSVASKGFSLPVNPLQSTLMGILVSVASKELECGGLRLKPGKTRCLSVSADSERLSGESLAPKQKTPASAGATYLQPQYFLFATILAL